MGILLLVDEAGYLRQKNGRVIGDALVDGIPGVVAHKKGIVAEIIGVFFIRIGGDAQGPDMHDLRLGKGLGVCFDIFHQGPQRVLGFAAGCADEDPVAPMDVRKNFILGGKFFLIFLPEIFQDFFVYGRHGIFSWVNRDRCLSGIIILCVRFFNKKSALRETMKRKYFLSDIGQNPIGLPLTLLFFRSRDDVRVILQTADS